MTKRGRTSSEGGALGYLLAALGGFFFAVIFMGLGAWLYQKFPVGGAGIPSGGDQPLQRLVGDIKVVSPESGDALTLAVKKVGPSVANIDTTYRSRSPHGNLDLPDMFRDLLPKEFLEPVPRESKGKGSGLVFDASKGYVLTNAHVVEGATTIQVSLPDKREFEGKVLGSDELSDIAVVQIKGNNLPQAQLGTSKDLEPGAWSIAIGNPYGYANTVTVGVISATGRKIMAREDKVLDHLIQTDAAINPGNSGGPLCNIKGEVIGINTAIVPFAQGIGFAIAVDKAKEIAEEIIKHGKILHPYIGVKLQDVSDLDKGVREYLRITEKKGAFIFDVEPGSPADAAGVQKGDVIREIDHKEMAAADDVVKYVQGRKIGDEVALAVWRKSEMKVIKIKVANRLRK